MKKSFKVLLNEIFADDNKWNYYVNSDIAINNPFDCGHNAKEFIKNFIKLSGKSSSSNILYKKIDGLEDYRAIHIVSTFFFGIYIYENSNLFKSKISKELKKYQDKSKYHSNVEFAFVWFICCLFHDLGYEFEDDKNPKHSCFYDFYKENNLKSLNRVVGVPKLYKNIHKDYFNYRAKKNKNDHGICGAYILFKDLCKIREDEEKLNNNGKLSWENELENVYNFASWIILSHNIWYANEWDKCAVECYNKEKLDELILKEKEYKISLDKYPFLFLFSLVDSIEPLKRIKDTQYLNEIFVEINVNNIVIESNLDCGCHTDILKQANGLNNWLTKTEIIDNKVIIDLIVENGK